LPEWGVTVVLVADRVPQLAVVRQPLGDLTYTPVEGGGPERIVSVGALGTGESAPVAGVSKATVAAAMLDATRHGPRGQVLVPLTR
jgi:hypothetical protein